MMREASVARNGGEEGGTQDEGFFDFSLHEKYPSLSRCKVKYV